MAQVTQVLDEYRLDAVLRTTVHTTVFQAAIPSTSKPVVVKLVNPPAPEVDEATRAQFMETLAVAQGSSVRALPRIRDFGFTPEGNAFIVSDLIRDAVTPLSAFRGDPPERLVPILVALLDAADELAIAGFHHLNVSPDNVLVVGRGVRLVGFGTAAYLCGARSVLWPPPGDRYAAPEMFGNGVLQRDDRWLADLYSVALIACDYLGVDVENPGTAEPRATVRGSESDASREFESLAAAALRTDPGTRSVSVSEFRRALAQVEFPGIDPSLDAIGDALLRVSGVSNRVRQDEVPEEKGDTGEAALAESMPPAGPARPVAPARVATGEPAPQPPAPAVAPTVERSEEPGADPFSDTKPSSRVMPELARFPWRLVAIAGGAMVVLTIVSALLISALLHRPEPEIAPVVQRPVPTVAPTPVPIDEPPSLHPLLQQAQQRLVEADLDGARKALEALSDDDVELFSDTEKVIYDQMVGLFESDDFTASLQDLRRGLQQGSIRMLRRGVVGVGEMPPEEIRAEPGLPEDLERARAALRTHQQMWDASKAGTHLAVIEHANRMITLLPEYGGTYELREEAATAIETAAEASISSRDLEGAVRQLEGLHRVWPDREGLVERIEWCRQQETTDRQMQSVLERALRTGANGDPEAGLTQLAATTPSTDFADRFAEARRVLRAQLAALDSEPPTLELPPDFAPQFRKKDTVVVPLTVTDDYRVERVVVFVRGSDEDGFREVPLRSPDGVVYPFEVTPELRGKGDVAFYAVAEDRSGHQGRLGSAEQPLVLERKRWFRK